MNTVARRKDGVRECQQGALEVEKVGTAQHIEPVHYSSIDKRRRRRCGLKSLVVGVEGGWIKGELLQLILV